MIMALFRAHNTGVALWQLTKARIAVTLTKAFVGFFTAMAAENRLLEVQGDRLTEHWIQRDSMFPHR